MNEAYTKTLSERSRAHALRMVHKVNASHIGACLSVADILAVLYGGVLRVRPDQPAWPQRDRFILSKGHAAAVLYGTLAECGFFPVEWLDRYCQEGCPLMGHVSSRGVPGVEVSTGSLGHGLPIGCGMALAAKREGAASRVFVVLSDGELDEGSNWEAILFAGHHRLDNLVVIVDYNKLQGFGRTCDVLNVEPLEAKWVAFGWAARQLDGHNHEVIHAALSSVPFESGKPSVVIAHTVKGKGVSYMEDELAWHYKSPNQEQLTQALKEVRGARD